MYLFVGKNCDNFLVHFEQAFVYKIFSRDFDRDLLLLILLGIDGKLCGRPVFSSPFADIRNIIFKSRFLNMNIYVYDLYTLFWTK